MTVTKKTVQNFLSARTLHHILYNHWSTLPCLLRSRKARVKNNLPFHANLGNTVFFWFSRQAVMLDFWKLFLLFHFLPIQDQNTFQYCSSSFVNNSAVISWDHKVSAVSFLGKNVEVMANYPDSLNVCRYRFVGRRLTTGFRIIPSLFTWLSADIRMKIWHRMYIFLV